MIHVVRFAITTTAGGAYDSSTDGGVVGNIVAGSGHPALFLYKVVWVDGTMDDGVDAVLSATSGYSDIVSETLLTLTDANSDAVYYPQVLVKKTDGTTAATDFFVPQLTEGTLKLVVSSGGNAKTGACYVFLTDKP